MLVAELLVVTVALGVRALLGTIAPSTAVAQPSAVEEIRMPVEK